MKRRRLQPSDYTVGWVCALPIELAAAQRMLDEEHEDQRSCEGFGDSNLYTLGRIGEHNVVITCLPAGQVGTNSAASVAMRMSAKFKAIRFGLMVGIGGGVPNVDSADVHLGDVVVSQPTMGHGGVVQYDYGKTTPDGFRQTGFLNAPPILLLNALAMQQANYSIGCTSIPTLLAAFDDLPIFTRNNAGPDYLFEPTYEHIGRSTCESCDERRLVARAARDPPGVKVHYGTIASGNQVIKDGKLRDKLSSDLGDVLCFEMEAAGLMNNFPCLVIRGICDYADSHKNKKWQPYAAATAAACAKEILNIVPGELKPMDGDHKLASVCL